jgi:PAS domain S-box-containing protein
MTLFRRFFLLLLAWTLISMGGIGWLAYRMARAARESAATYHHQIADFNYGLLSAFARDFNARFTFVSDLEKQGPNSGLVFKTLQSAAAAYPDLAFLSIVDDKGNEGFQLADSMVFDRTPSKELWDEPRASAAKTLAPAMGKVTEVGGHPVLPVAFPIKDGRVVLAGMSLDSLWKSIRSEHVGPTGRVLLADLEGVALPLFGEGAPPKLAMVGGSSDGWFEQPGPAGGWVGAYRRSDSFHWTVATLQPRDEAYLQADEFAKGAAILFIALAAAAAYASIWLSQKIAAPLTDMVAGAKRVSSNKFDVPVKEGGWAEMKDLAKSLNLMMGELKKFNAIQIDKVLEEKGKVDALVQTIPEGILMTDLAGKIVFANGKLFPLLGKPTPNSLPAVQMNVLVTEKRVLDMTGALLRKEQRWSTCETESTDQEGVRRWLRVLGTLVTIGKRDSGLLLLFRDVTTEKELENMKKSFFNAIIHDLRAPLTTLQSYIDISRMNRALTALEEKYFPNARLAIEDLTRLIEDILDLAKLEAGGIELNKEKIDMAALVEKNKNLFDLPMQLKGIKLEVLSETGMAVQIDRRKMERVIGNLLSNARKFTPQGGTITLAASRSGQAVELSVSDTGPGIPADKIDSLFKPFEQLDTGKKEGSGFGLGLSICKSVVELHGGKIWVTSTVGQGSRFAFTVPLSS